jgi:hypothetical protein
MSDKVLIDTNVWIYLDALNPQANYEKSQQLIHENFANVILRVNSESSSPSLRSTRFFIEERGKEG